MANILCKDCNIPKPASEFYVHKKTGLMQPCKDCCRTYQKEHAQQKKAEDPGAWRQKAAKRLAEWRKKNPEKAKASSKRNDAKRIEKRRITRKRYRQLHPAFDREKKAQWYYANRDTILPRNAARLRELRKLDPAKMRLRDTIARHRRRGLLKALPNTFTQAQREFMRQYWGYACAVCGNQEGFQWTLSEEHWLPLSSPDCPGTVATNMLPFCHGVGGCNNSKHDVDGHAWLIRRFGPRKAAKIEKAILSYFAIVAAREAAAD